MYEGKNIHYSSADSKALCSFSGKLCNQRRLNGYGFCVRHILEDPTAPFKRCAYVAKSSNQMCTQAIPRHEERRYCNNHMQVLGMLPKKERKKKDKPGVVADNKLHMGNSGSVKAKFSLSKDSTTSVIKPPPAVTDFDDPYAFSDTGSTENKQTDIQGTLLSTCDSILGKSLQTGQGFVRSASDINSTPSFSLSGGSTIAKYYPELAEKLEKMRAKPEVKLAPKNRARNARTMNKLQNKIAQNKINEKLRKSQELNQTDSNSSPLQVSSPEPGMDYDLSPSSVSGLSPSSLHTFSPQASHTGSYSTNFTVSCFDQPSGQEVHSLPHIDTSFLASLAAPDSLGFQNALGDAGLSEQLLVTHTPPRLPPPYPGSSTLSTPSSLASADLPAAAFSPQTHLNCVLDTASSLHSPQRTIVTQSGPSGPTSSLTSATSFTSLHPLNTNLSSSTPAFLSPVSSSSFSSSSNYPFSSAGSTNSLLPGFRSMSDISSGIPPPNVDIFSILNGNTQQLSVDPKAGLTHTLMLPSPNTLAAHLSLPPPPPYVPPVVQPKATVVSQPSMQVGKLLQPSSLASPCVASKLPSLHIPHAKIRKVTGILPEKAAKQKLKSDLAAKFYSLYADRKMNSYSMVGPYLGSSDDDSEDEDVDMVPWQRDNFSASSDEEADGDDGLGNDVPMGMRPTKLSLLKTRLRRQWCQARNAYQTNQSVRSHNNKATLALIQTARESSACAVRALWQITHVKKSSKKLQKRLKKKKVCCHKNEKEGQCQNTCLPYANHCLKHITYNINQQLFDFCTAKFVNNVQCCLPTFDLIHELPLCQEHAAKTDNYQKQLELENKKRPRKKTKPPALTRPPRKGKKKKKKGRQPRMQIPIQQISNLDSALSDVDVITVDTVKNEEPTESASTFSSHLIKQSSSIPHSQSMAGTAGFAGTNSHKHVGAGLELEETLSPDFDKPFELPLEQASRLLDESDFQEVVNKMPFDALDLFGKNTETDPEVEHITADLSTASKARDALEKLLTGTMSEEESMQIAMLLAQNLQTDTDLVQNTGLISEAIASAAGQVEAGVLGISSSMEMDLNMAVHLGMSATSVGDGRILDMHAADLSDNLVLGTSGLGLHSSVQQHHVLHPHQPGYLQLPLSTATSCSPSASYGIQESLKISQAPFHQRVLSSPNSTSSTSNIDGIPSVYTPGLNSVFGHIDNVTQARLSAEQNSALSLGDVTDLKNYTNVSTAKTVIQHLPAVSQTITSVAGSGIRKSYVGSPNLYLPEAAAASSSSMSQLPSTTQLQFTRNIVNIGKSVASPSCKTTSSANTSPQSRHDTSIMYQPLPQQMLSRSSASSLELPSTLALSLPSQAKKAKLVTSSLTSSVITHQQPHHRPHTVQHHHHQPSQLSQQTVQNILQTSTPSRMLTVSDGNRNNRLSEKSSSPKPSPTVTTKPLILSGSSFRRHPLSVAETLQHRDNTKMNFSSALLTLDNPMVKPQPPHIVISDAGRVRISISDSRIAHNALNSLVSTTSTSHVMSKSSNTVRYSLTADNSLAPALTLTTTTLRHNFLTSPGGPTTESILVTVRQPSPLESVPTTVRHTLPDTLSTPITLPSSPSLHLLTPSTSSISAPSVSPSSLDAHDLQTKPPISNNTVLPSSSSTLSSLSLLSSSSSSPFSTDLTRHQWVPLVSNITLQNGSPFGASARAPLVNKLIPAGQGKLKNKQSNSAAEAARISALASAAGVPVVCNQVSLPGLVQGLATTTFKTSGSS